MALTAAYLLDTSATARLRKEPVRARLQPLIERGLAATCPLLDLEIGYSAQAEEDYGQLLADRKALYAWVPMPANLIELAQELQALLVRMGTHRGVGIADLMIAATADFHGLTVLHYDRDFDLLATTGRVKAEWIVPAGQAD